MEKPVWHLHIAALDLEQIIDNSGQHGHHPYKQQRQDFW